MLGRETERSKAGKIKKKRGEEREREESSDERIADGPRGRRVACGRVRVFSIFLMTVCILVKKKERGKQREKERPSIASVNPTSIRSAWMH